METANIFFEEISFTVCMLSNLGKVKTGNTFYPYE